MELYEVIIILIINLLSFVIGAKIGQSSSKGKDITVNPIKAIKNVKEENDRKKVELLEQRKIQTMFDNIDNYDGSGLGQKEIPKE